MQLTGLWWHGAGTAIIQDPILNVYKTLNHII